MILHCYSKSLQGTVRGSCINQNENVESVLLRYYRLIPKTQNPVRNQFDGEGPLLTSLGLRSQEDRWTLQYCESRHIGDTVTVPVT